MASKYNVIKLLIQAVNNIMITCYGCHLIRAQRVIIVGMNNGDLSVLSRNILERTQFVIKDGNCLI